MYNQVQKLASAIRNDIVSGLRGMHSNLSLSQELLELDVVDERLQIIKEYSLKGISPLKDLYISIDCIAVDCKNIENCRCSEFEGTLTMHFEIPLIVTDYGVNSIEYIGSIDRGLPFIVYTSPHSYRMHKYRKRGKNKPYVYINTNPNERGMCDCYVFNAPLLKLVSVSAIFKDLRLLDELGCCSELTGDNYTFINNEIKKRVTAKKVQYYRLLAAPIMPNDQSYQPG